MKKAWRNLAWNNNLFIFQVAVDMVEVALVVDEVSLAVVEVVKLISIMLIESDN